jgi:hypothetical protein
VTSDNGLEVQGLIDPSSSSDYSRVRLELGADDFDRSRRLVVAADPANEIAEQNETNNTLMVVAEVPSPRKGGQTVQCMVLAR